MMIIFRFGVVASPRDGTDGISEVYRLLMHAVAITSGRLPTIIKS